MHFVKYGFSVNILGLKFNAVMIPVDSEMSIYAQDKIVLNRFPVAFWIQKKRNIITIAPHVSSN